jgi:hypothetical protein
MSGSDLRDDLFVTGRVLAIEDCGRISWWNGSHTPKPERIRAQARDAQDEKRKTHAHSGACVD